MTLQLRQIQLKNFRCFESQTLSLEKPLVLIEGENGSGKTTLLEALHYLCYLRSFRTHLPRDMVAFEQDNFFIRVTLETSAPNEIAQAHEIQAGFTAKRRLVKVDNKAICSYKELMDYYRVVTLTEDDLSLITGGPEERRNFLDQALLLDNPDYIETLRRLRATTQQRNALLQAGRFSNDSYLFWTEQLWQQSCEIQRERAALLTSFEQEISRLVEKHLTDGKNDYPCTITCTYKPKKNEP